MRDRLEDLGRIYEILTGCLDSKLFDPHYFANIEKESLDATLDALSCELEFVKHQLDRAWEIASAQDHLNEDEIL